MANDLNLCQFIGRLGDTPEVKYMPNGNAVANFSIAVSKSWKDQQGQKQEKTEWVRCTAYRKLAEIIGEYLRKGSQVYISGSQETRKWQDQQGQDRYTTEIIVDQMQMLGGKSESNQGSQQNSGYQQRPPARQQPQAQGQNVAQGSMQKPPMTEPNFDLDSEIPFSPIELQYRGIINAM